MYEKAAIEEFSVDVEQCMCKAVSDGDVEA